MESSLTLSLLPPHVTLQVSVCPQSLSPPYSAHTTMWLWAGQLSIFSTRLTRLSPGRRATALGTLSETVPTASPPITPTCSLPASSSSCEKASPHSQLQKHNVLLYLCYLWCLPEMFIKFTCFAEGLWALGLTWPNNVLLYLLSLFVSWRERPPQWNFPFHLSLSFKIMSLFSCDNGLICQDWVLFYYTCELSPSFMNRFMLKLTTKTWRIFWLFAFSRCFYCFISAGTGFWRKRMALKISAACAGNSLAVSFFPGSLCIYAYSKESNPQARSE